MAEALASAAADFSANIAATTLHVAFPTWVSADGPYLGTPRLLSARILDPAVALNVIFSPRNKCWQTGSWCLFALGYGVTSEYMLVVTQRRDS